MDYYDLGIEHRDATDDQVTVDAAEAIKRHGVGVKCATITPDEARVEGVQPQEDVAVAQRHHPKHPGRHHLPRADRHLERAAAGARLDQADHHRPSRVRRPVPRRQHQGRTSPAPSRVTFTPDDGSEPIVHDVVEIPEGGGVVMGMYNFKKSIQDFARVVVQLRAATELPGLPVDEEHHPQGLRRHVQGRVPAHLRRGVQGRSSTRKGLTYEHRLIDDMVAACLKWEGGYVWACKNYDGDVQSDTVAQGYGSLGLMTSVLMTPDGKTVEAEAAHGTVTRHYRQHQQGKPTSTNPIASIFAWTRGLEHRGKLDNTPDVIEFAEHAGGRACIEHGRGRPDDQGPGAADRRQTRPYQTSEEFLGPIADNLKKALDAASRWPRCGGARVVGRRSRRSDLATRSRRLEHRDVPDAVEVRDLCVLRQLCGELAGEPRMRQHAVLLADDQMGRRAAARPAPAGPAAAAT